jgi:hypothetical protein
MTDRNPSDLGFMEELPDEELLAINGGYIIPRRTYPIGGSFNSTSNNPPRRITATFPQRIQFWSRRSI